MAMPFRGRLTGRRWVSISVLLIVLLSSATAGRPSPAAEAAPAGLAAADWQSIQSMLAPSQQAYLKASNPDSVDVFGSAVAVSGDTVVVAAPDEDSAATGVGGDQGDNSLEYPGAVYVFVRNDGPGGPAWTQQAYLKASNTGARDAFGYSIAVDGDTIVVGAPQEASAATGVNGNQADNSAFGAGAAYVFVRSGGTWAQQAYLKASNTGPYDWFGSSVAIDGDTIIVGAIDDDSSTSGVNSIPNNASVSTGAAYVFVRSGDAQGEPTWRQEAYLKASNPDREDYFGTSLALDGDTLVVSAGGEDSSTTGVNSAPDEGALVSGAAYVFVRSCSAWRQQAYLKASNTRVLGGFGASVAVHGNTIAVGAHSENSAATGVNGDQTDTSLLGAGAVYVFVRSGSAWSQQAYIKASNTGTGDSFGISVALHGRTLLVGARQEASAATGIGGDQSDNSAMNAGAAYVFVRSGSTWAQESYLKASNNEAFDYFAWSVALDGDTAVIGSVWEDSAATGVNGNQSDNGIQNSGAAYVMSGMAAPVEAASMNYLPLLVNKGSWLVEINAQAISTRPVTTARETYYTVCAALPESLPDGGRFYFSSAPDRVQPIKVDDELVVTVNGQERLAAFATYPLTVEVPRAEITQWLGQDIVVSFRDRYGSVVGSTPVWLIWAP